MNTELRWKIGRHYLACTDSTKIEDFYPAHGCDLTFTDPPFDMDACQQFETLIKTGVIYIVAGCGNNYIRLCNYPHLQFYYEVVCLRSKPQSLSSWHGPNILHWNNAFLTHGGVDHCFDKDLVGGYFPSILGPYKNPIIGNYGKPIGYALDILKACHAQTVAEPFAGTGTTMAACEQLGKTCYAVEIQPERCQLIINRMKKMGLSVEEF